MNRLIKLATLVLAMTGLSVNAGQQVHKSLPVDGAHSVVVKNQQGKVTVSTWDQDSVEVDGTIADEAEKFIFERRDDRIVIKVKLPDHQRRFNRHELKSNLTIKLPSSMRFDFSGIASDISLSGLSKSSKVETVSGDIKASKLSDYIDISTVSGNIDSRSLSGKIRLASVSGDIKDINSDGDVEFKVVSGNVNTRSSATELNISSVSGDIDFSLKQIDELEVSTVSGQVEGELSLNDNGLLEMNSVSGDFDIAFTNDVQASFKMSANAGGHFSNRITDDREQRAKYGPSSKLHFTTGNGSASVKATTVSGEIRVSKK